MKFCVENFHLVYCETKKKKTKASSLMILMTKEKFLVYVEKH